MCISAFSGLIHTFAARIVPSASANPGALFLFRRNEMASTCVTCRYYRGTDAASKIGYCFCAPPVIVVLPQAVAMSKMQLRTQPQEGYTVQPASVRPLVRETDTCKEWVSG
jgi:hypothetical protein